jgi:TPR repeat protein
MDDGGVETSSSWIGLATAGGIAGAVPFAIQSATYSVTTVDGAVTSFVYRDWLAVVCGVAAAILAIATLRAAPRNLIRKQAIAAGLGLLVLGAAQIARGFGVFATPPTESRTTIETSVAPSASAPVVDPHNPATCPDADSCFQLGRQLDEAKDTAGAITAYERSCERGGDGGCFNAGFLWKHRDPPDHARAVAAFQRGCSDGEAASCNELGLAYRRGQGAAKDPAQAQRAFKTACDGRLGIGCDNLAELYEVGEGVAKDLDHALRLYKQACDLDESEDTADACELAGNMLQADGGRRDPKLAASYYAKACERTASRCFGLAISYVKGVGVAKDLAKARELYRRACDAGDADSCNNLGILLQSGLGGPKDLAAAQTLFEQACKAGVAIGCDNAKPHK